MFILTNEGESLFLNGEPLDREQMRNKQLRAQTAYYPNGTNEKLLEYLMEGDDTAWSGRNGGGASYVFKGKKGAFHVRGAAGSWGVEDTDPAIVARKIWNLITACAELEGGAGKTLASTAGRICRKFADPVGLGQLQPQFRTMAHASIHQGASVCMKGGARIAVEYDRIKAFLYSLYRPVPVSWAAYPGATIDDLSPDDQGMARAVLYLDPALWAGRLPPLPVKTSGGTIYPTGYVGGVWPLFLIFQALSFGAEMVELQDVALCACAPVHEVAADRMLQIKDDDIRKGAYTRYWGRLASCGGWEGTVQKKADTDIRLQGSILWWRWSGTTIGGTAPPDYRPDHAAWISCDNHREMNKVIHALPAGALVASHVDAIWVDADAHPMKAPEGFKEKARGTLRFYRTGTYNHDGELHAQGCPWPLRTVADMDRWIGLEENRGAQSWIRKWHGGIPAVESFSATSDPPFHPASFIAPAPPVPPACHPGAWENGWPTESYRPVLENMTINEVW